MGANRYSTSLPSGLPPLDRVIHRIEDSESPQPCGRRSCASSPPKFQALPHSPVFFSPSPFPNIPTLRTSLVDFPYGGIPNGDDSMFTCSDQSCILGFKRNLILQYNFEWDPYKAKQNLRKHKVSFERAAEVFLDPLAISIYDEQHSSDENRWITIGKEQTNLVLVVIHTFDEKNLDNCKIRFDLRQKGNKEGDQTIPG